MAFPSIGLGGALIGFLVLLVIYLIVVGSVLWLAGEIVVGRRVTFGEALAIAGAGTFLVGAVLFLLPSLLGLLAAFVVFLWLIRHYFKTGWFGAFGVTIMAGSLFHRYRDSSRVSTRLLKGGAEKLSS
ncbi:MAG: hypothetical protein AUJ07_07595 [Crenarchaeota archaeon 13_1_40CM_3_53_5]|nr:MAG: hypothetical protein AUJ07_07595 [Crenarchaeota archaeon 13_1_40CM_3_53_5]